MYLVIYSRWWANKGTFQGYQNTPVKGQNDTSLFSHGFDVGKVIKAFSV